MSPHDQPSIEVITEAGQAPACPRCGGQTLLSARLPNGWKRSNGQRTDGTTVVTLCPTCDADQPAAGALITFFHVHGIATMDTADELAGLLTRWVGSIKLPKLDLNALNSEIDAWYKGELE